MQTKQRKLSFDSMGRWIFRNKWKVVLIWILLIVGAASLAPKFQSSMKTTELFIRGSEAKVTEQKIQKYFSNGYDEQDILVFQSSDSITNAINQQWMTETLSKVAKVDGVISTVSPLSDPAMRAELIAKDDRTALALVALKGDNDALEKTVDRINQVAQSANNGDAQSVYLTGNTPTMKDLIQVQGKDLGKAEMFGIPVAVIVLILAFGSLIAASLPLGLGMTGLITTFGVLGGVSYFHAFDTTVQSMTSMIGLGVGIDYVLFLVRRFREELQLGKSVEDAIAHMLATTGKAILFSGLTVMISMAGLFWFKASIFTNIAIGTMVVVAVMLAISLTLLPAILGLLGARVNKLRVLPKKWTQPKGDVRHSFWYRWSAIVMKKPVRWMALATLLLVLMMSQVMGMKLGMNTGTDVIANEPSGKGMKILSEKFSSGMLAPVNIVIQNKAGALTPADWANIDRFTKAVAKEDEVFRVDSVPTMLSAMNQDVPYAQYATVAKQFADMGVKQLWNVKDGADVTLIRVTLHDGSDSLAATDWIHHLQNNLEKQYLNTNALDVTIGGSTKAIAELSDETWGKTPHVVLTVLGLSFLLLMVAFRSWLIPLKAIVLNLLSVGASFGILVWVFMGGHGTWIGIDQIEFVQVFLPVIAFTVLFGLSMDYELFLVGRMKEEWEMTKDVELAIANGLSHSSSGITQAAIIMISVFLAFMFTKGDTQQIGFALGMAILIDVTIVRSILVPATMKWMGPRAWSVPKWLDRILPHIELSEGESRK